MVLRQATQLLRRSPAISVVDDVIALKTQRVFGPVSFIATPLRSRYCDDDKLFNASQPAFANVGGVRVAVAGSSALSSESAALRDAAADRCWRCRLAGGAWPVNELVVRARDLAGSPDARADTRR